MVTTILWIFTILLLGCIAFIGIKIASILSGDMFTDSADRLREETEHYVQVNAVIALTEAMTNQPDLIDNIGEYTRQTVAAALLNKVNALATDIKVAQRELSQKRLMEAKYGSSYQSECTRLEAMCDDLQDQLANALKASQALQGLQLVR